MIRSLLLAICLAGCCDIAPGDTVYKASNGISGEVTRVSWVDGCECDVSWQGQMRERGVPRYRLLIDIGEE